MSRYTSFAVELGYPGHFAPASLKRLSLQGAALGFSRYPGHFAPASLKLGSG